MAARPIASGEEVGLLCDEVHRDLAVRQLDERTGIPGQRNRQANRNT